MFADLMEESKLTMLQRKKVNYSLRSGKPLPALNSRSEKLKTSKTEIFDRPESSKRRSYESIIESGAYERDRYIPKQRGVDRDHAKEHLQNVMMYGKDAKDILKPKPKKVEKDNVNMNRFDELKQEIQERVEFLADMEKLGQEHRYKQIIEQQIASRIREMKTLQPTNSNP